MEEGDQNDFSLLDFVNEFYIGRIEDGWSMKDCDQADIVHWCELYVWKQKRDYMNQLKALDNSSF